MQIDNILGYAPNRYMRWHGGIYAIRNPANEYRYIGQTVCFLERYKQHQYYLRAGKHACQWLQADWDKYGEQHFCFDMLIVYRTDDLRSGIVVDLGPLEWMIMKQDVKRTYNARLPAWRLKGKLIHEQLESFAV